MKNRTPRDDTPPDPSIPLKNPRHEKVLMAYFNALPQANMTEICHKVGGYKKGPGLNVTATRMLKRAKFAARLKWLQEQAASKNVLTKQQYAEGLTQIWRTRHSDFLTMSADGVWFHDIGPETLNQIALKKVKTRVTTEKRGSGDAEVTIEKQFDEIELESKLQAGKQLAELFGWDAKGAESSVSVLLEKDGTIRVVTNAVPPCSIKFPEHKK